MTVPSADDRERLLAELLAGERSVRDPAIDAILQRDPKLSSELAGLLPLVERLNAAGGRERALLRAAATEYPVQAGQELQPSQPSIMPYRRARWLALAAAALVLVGLVLHFGQFGPVGDDGMPDDTGTLSAAELTLEAPRQVDGKIEFRWQVAHSVPTARFDAVIYDPALGRDLPILRRPIELESSTTWTIDASQVQQFPAASMLRVVATLQGRTVARERALR